MASEDAMETLNPSTTKSSSFSEDEREALANSLNFVPNFRSLQLSAQHRLQNSSNRKSLGSALSRKSVASQSKMVRRRVCKSAASSVFTETSESDADAKSVLTELDVLSEETQQLDGTTLEEPDDLGVQIINKDEEDISQRRYRTACRTLHVTPTTRILNSLTTTEINLSSHVIGERGAQACALALMINGTVERLDLEGNALGPIGTWHICKMLKENIFITDLSLAMNKLGTKGLRYITHAMTDMDTVKKLNLSANGFKDVDAVYIAEILKENMSLEELNLSYNEFREKGGEIIGEALAKNSCLEVLDLSWNHLRLSGAEAISQSIGRNKSIKTLNLGWNGFHIEGCRQLATSLETNDTLEHLDLTCNRINMTCLDYILKGLRKNTTISQLTLARNPLSSDGALALLDLVFNTPQCNLTYINILGQDVGQDFMRRFDEVRETRGESLTVIYGRAMHEDQIKSLQEEEFTFAKQDPITILMEYIRLKNLRLVDMFRRLDGDNSKSISREEFKNGLMSSGIPVTEPMLDRIISKLDTNNNGEIEYNELIAGQREHKRKVNKLLETSAMNEVPFEQTELGTISEKLRHIMKIKEYFWPNKVKRWKNAACLTGKATSVSTSQQTDFIPMLKDQDSDSVTLARHAEDNQTPSAAR